MFAVLFVVVSRTPSFVTATFHMPSVRTVLSSLLLVQNLTKDAPILYPLWSLPWEVQMYLVLPFLFFALSRFSSSRFPLILLLGVVGINITLAPIQITHILQYFPCFLCGALAFRAMQSRRRPPISSWLWIPFVMAAAAATLATLTAYESAGFVIISLIWYAGCFAIGVAIPLFREIPRSAISTSAHLIAKYSYGIYLSHVPILWFAFVKMTSIPVAARWGLAVVLIVAVPVALYHLIEQPAIDFGRKLTQAHSGNGRSSLAQDRNMASQPEWVSDEMARPAAR
jgi:peptidoglycan/LPS O-acetylase OafA/YrhL